MGAFSIRSTFIPATVPIMTVAPIEVSSTETTITVSWLLTSTGGSVITGYRLYQTNVTTGGEYLAYDGLNVPTVSSYMASSLTPGNRYQFRASSINRVGESLKTPFSAVIIAAMVPSQPSVPTFVFSTSTSITLLLSASSNNGGSPVTSYVIYADDSNQNKDNFTPVLTFNGQTLSWTIL